VMIIAVLLLAVAQGANGAYTYTYGPSDFTGQLSLYTNESILFQGGAVGYLRLYDNSSARIESTRPGGIMNMQTVGAGDTSNVQMTGGQIESFSAINNSTVSFSGGYVALMAIAGSSNVTLSGGNIGTLMGGHYMTPDVTIVCKDHSYNLGTRILSVTWADNSMDTMLISNVTPDYNIYSQIHFSIVPEPLSLALFGLGGAVVWRYGRNSHI
jgi:hypothetical protein